MALPPPPGQKANPNILTAVEVETGAAVQPAVVFSEPKAKGFAKGITQEVVTQVFRERLLPEHLKDPRVHVFISEYLRCRNVAEAAQIAKLTTRDGKALMQRPDIYETIGDLTARAMVKYGFDAEEVVARVKEILDTDMAAFQREDGTWIENMQEVPPEVRRAVRRFKVKNIYETDVNGIREKVGRMIDVEFWDKQRAADSLGAEKGIFKRTTKVEHDITKNMKDTLLGAAARAERLGIAPPERIVQEIMESGNDDTDE